MFEPLYPCHLNEIYKYCPRLELVIKRVGKGEVMPKRSRSKKKKLHFSEAEQVLIGLEKIYKSGSEDARTAHSLASWWLEHKSWTTAQWSYAKSLIAKSKRKKVSPTKKKKYYVYAITDGEFVKIGYSNDVPKRMKSMQTGHPKRLDCIWKYYAGDKPADAIRIEGKLHRYCKKHRVRGEWFSMASVKMIDNFSVSNYRKRAEIEEELDRQLLESSPI